ncbi:hypothetical protein M885DRAFT_529592 [Pelagophyceae sp. CCMP2097]|nr:hypothetical protein M885DRAFT_529592 [Pelagophyceae sp. CCMP2097]
MLLSRSAQRQLALLDGPVDAALHVHVLLDGRLRVLHLSPGHRIADVAAAICGDVLADTDVRARVDVVAHTEARQGVALRHALYTKKLLQILGEFRAGLGAQAAQHAAQHAAKARAGTAGTSRSSGARPGTQTPAVDARSLAKDARSPASDGRPPASDFSEAGSEVGPLDRAARHRELHRIHDLRSGGAHRPCGAWCGAWKGSWKGQPGAEGMPPLAGAEATKQARVAPRRRARPRTVPSPQPLSPPRATPRSPGSPVGGPSRLFSQVQFDFASLARPHTQPPPAWTQPTPAWTQPRRAVAETPDADACSAVEPTRGESTDPFYGPGGGSFADDGSVGVAEAPATVSLAAAPGHRREHRPVERARATRRPRPRSRRRLRPRRRLSSRRPSSHRPSSSPPGSPRRSSPAPTPSPPRRSAPAPIGGPGRDRSRRCT